jgi:chaperone modulatory protein CbpM
MSRQEWQEQDTSPLELGRLCVALRVEVSALAEFIEVGVAAPRTGLHGELVVSVHEAARLARALRLARELELHAAGAAIVVELLEERESLHRRLRALECLLGSSR